MSKFEAFEASVLRVAPAEVVPNCHFGFNTTTEGAKNQIPEPLIREILLSMCERGLIWMSIYDGAKETTIQEWLSRNQSLDGFFFNKTDSGNVRVRLRLAGAAYRDAANKASIGFGTPP